MGHYIGNGAVGGGNGNRADACCLRALEHMHDHGAARDIGKRFARQTGRGHPGRNQDNRVHGVWVWAIRNLSRRHGPPAAGACFTPGARQSR
ncbi:hypothetical protein AA15973_2647 [Komagataeibacter sucrofermentans DSM 15973]|nr:hypothetical protein AA15973_2647 [Komagataeibacter sucrofermentans DSM 15973]